MTDPKFPEDRQRLLFYHYDDSTEKASKARHRVRRFWFIVVPLSGIVAGMISLASQTNVFGPCWVVCAIVGGCWDQGDSD